MNFLHPPGRRIMLFRKAEHVFEVFQQSTDRGDSYLGFYDGRISVVAGRRELVAKMLLARHVRVRRSNRRQGST
jgi:hypothetical protein